MKLAPSHRVRVEWTNPTGRAFSLMEMLVVISLITLLMAMLMPSLSSARENARRTKCLTNTRSQSQAFTAYADEHQGLLPTADQTTHWNLNALYVMDKEVGYQLSGYGALTNPQDGSTPASNVETPWKCPSRDNYPRLFIAGHSSGVLHIDQYMILSGLDVQGVHPYSRLQRPTPSHIDDPTGLITAEHTGVYTSDQAWFSNHMTSFGPAGHNQSYTDGHARWYNAAEFDMLAPNVPDALWDSGWPWWWSWVAE